MVVNQEGRTRYISRTGGRSCRICTPQCNFQCVGFTLLSSFFLLGCDPPAFRFVRDSLFHPFYLVMGNVYENGREQTSRSTLSSKDTMMFVSLLREYIEGLVPRFAVQRILGRSTRVPVFLDAGSSTIRPRCFSNGSSGIPTHGVLIHETHLAVDFAN